MTAPQLLELSLASPEENLALDEALLLDSEKALAAGLNAAEHEWLRVWESSSHFVVLGVSGKLEQEVHVDRCRQLRVPILRRSSGGGTVVQGPGCLNFSLVLSLAHRPVLRNLRASYRYILEQTASKLMPGAQFRGTSDLAIANLKFSGNAQKRTRHALLHHGTILYNFDIGFVERLLKMPTKQPEYRNQRSHEMFCKNLPLELDELTESILTAWKTTRPRARYSLPDTTELIREKYGNADWTERF